MDDVRKLSDLQPGDRFKLVFGNDVMDIPLELVRFDGEFAHCRHLHPQLLDETPPPLSVPGAFVQLITE